MNSKELFDEEILSTLRFSVEVYNLIHIYSWSIGDDLKLLQEKEDEEHYLNKIYMEKGSSEIKIYVYCGYDDNVFSITFLEMEFYDMDKKKIIKLIINQIFKEIVTDNPVVVVNLFSLLNGKIDIVIEQIMSRLAELETRVSQINTGMTVKNGPEDIIK